MILIAHRGNMNGSNKLCENEPSYIDIAIQNGFDVEIDVWYKDKILYLGHDSPDYKINLDWLSFRINKLWIHCKNIAAIEFFSQQTNKYHFFWHQEDVLTLTSHNYIWAYPGNQPIMNSIAVMPELFNDDLSMCLGICSDFIKLYSE